MHSAQLLQHFDTLAETPDAVEKLRDLILNIAVRGLLVSHPAGPEKDSCWKDFCTEFDDRLFCADSTPLYDPRAAAPYEIPPSWRWLLLHDVADSCGQKKPDARFSYIDVGAIDNVKGVIIDDVEVLTPDTAPSRARKLVALNSVIYSTVRPYLRNIAIINRVFSPPAIVSTAFAVMHPKPFLDSRYLYHWLRSQPFQTDVARKMKGVAYPAISDSELWECLIPVPPPAEQKRIVAKVEELLALCDELEAQQTAAREHRTRLVRSALDHLTTAPDEPAFQKHAAFALQNSDLVLDSVPALRQAILALTVQGRLIPTNLTKWKHQPLSTIAKNIVDCPHSTPKWTETGRICVRTNQFRPGLLDLTSPRYVSDETFHERIQRLQPKADDVLYSREGGILGIACRVPPNTEICLGQRMMLIRAGDTLHPAFLELVLNSPQITSIARRETTGGAAPHVNVSTVRSYPIPIPPLAEQQRIVAKVDELMKWCDELEARLTTAQTAAAALLDATLHQILAA